MGLLYGLIRLTVLSREAVGFSTLCSGAHGRVVSTVERWEVAWAGVVILKGIQLLLYFE